LKPEKESLIRVLIGEHKNFRSEVSSFVSSVKELDESQKMRAEHIIGWHKQHVLREETRFKLVLEELLRKIK